jgi:tetratricopeptide (TPR) repeat protein
MKTLMCVMMSLVLTIAAAVRGQDQNAVNTMLLDGKIKFETAYLRWNFDDMITAKAIFERALAIDPKSVDAMYWNGYAGYRLVIYNLYGAEKNEDAAKKYMEDAINVLEAAINIDAHHSESFALLGTLTGMKISFNPVSAMWLGPMSNGYYDDAIKANPDNPRAYFLKGLGKMNTPAIFGGGSDKAITAMERAVVLYEKEKVDSSSIKPDWGFAECHTFLGQCYAANSDNNKAKDHYSKALALNPYSRRAKDGLAKLENGK